MIEWKIVARVLAAILLIVSLFFVGPIIIAYIMYEQAYIIIFFIPLIIGLSISVSVLFITRTIRSDALGIRESALLVTFSWICMSALCALPYYISGIIPSYAGAFFEAMSGLTTTGATVLTDIEIVPYSLLFWRALTHWMGGMGIVVLTVALLPILGIGGTQLMKAEAPGPELDKVTSKISHTAKILWNLYVGITICQVILLLLGGMHWYDALIHSFATIATGGFSSKNASIGHYQSAYIHWVFTFFMFLAGINFILYYRMLTGKWHIIKKNTELHAYIGIVVVVSVLMALELWHNNIYTSFIESIQYTAFQVVSIVTTTEFATTDYLQWSNFAQTLIFILMFIGGCAGSTAGGIKVIRIVTIFWKSIGECRYQIFQKGIFPLRINGMIIKKNTVYTIVGFIFIYLLLLLLITSLITLIDGYDVFTAYSTALATLGNIGPGFGLVGPTGNYSIFSDTTLWILSNAMLLGRLEIFTVIILFTRKFWIV